MPGIETFISAAEKLIRIHGSWPSFHDAEVIDVRLWRGRLAPGDWEETNVMPVLTAKVHIPKYGPTGQDTLVTLRFEDVDEFRMEGFNHQNAIFALTIRSEERGTLTDGERLPPWLLVEFQPAFGMSASFRCMRIEIVEAVPCTEAGDAQGS